MRKTKSNVRRPRPAVVARIGIVLAALAVVLPAARGQTPPAPNDLCEVIELEGQIDGLTGTTLEAQLKRALERSPRFVILTISSGGGNLEVAKDIAYNLSSNLPSGVRTIAWVRGEALSAATLVAFGCDEIAMSSQGSIGDMLPFLWQQGLLEQRVQFEAKLIPPWQKELCAFAEKRQYPVDAAAKMVDGEIELLRVDLTDPVTKRPRVEFVSKEHFESFSQDKRALVTSTEPVGEKGHPLVLKAVDAKKMGFAKYDPCDSLDTLLERVKQEHDLGHLQAERVPGLWWEHVVRFITNPWVKLTLFALGVIAFVIALLHPGLGVPEVVAIVAFGLCFFGSYLIGLATAIELIIFVLGVGLVAGEILGGMPGHGFMGATGGVLIFVSLLLSLQSFVIPSTPEQWAIFKTNVAATGAAIAITIFGLAIAMRFLPRTRFLKKLVHTDEQAADGGLALVQGALPGARGVAATQLRPAGKVEVDGKLIDAMAETGVIEKGTPIVVVGRRGPEVVVALLPAEPTAGGAS